MADPHVHEDDDAIDRADDALDLIGSMRDLISNDPALVDERDTVSTEDLVGFLIHEMTDLQHGMVQIAEEQGGLDALQIARGAVAIGGLATMLLETVLVDPNGERLAPHEILMIEEGE